MARNQGSTIFMVAVLALFMASAVSATRELTEDCKPDGFVVFEAEINNSKICYDASFFEIALGLSRDFSACGACCSKQCVYPHASLSDMLQLASSAVEVAEGERSFKFKMTCGKP